MKQGDIAIGLVGMRVDVRTRSAGELEEFLQGLDLPVVAHLRDTQVYVYCARDGYSVFDLPRSRGEQDREQWRPLDPLGGAARRGAGRLMCCPVSSEDTGADEVGRQARRAAESVVPVTVRLRSAAWRTRICPMSAANYRVN